MYRIATQRDFIAQHYLMGGDYGRENDLHSHHWVLEVEVEGEELSREGYLVDLPDLDENLDQRVAYFEEQVLNDLPEFEGLNPSPERFARILAEMLDQEIQSDVAQFVSVRLWQDESTWTSYRMEHAV
jgi:6-pyruvoyltetrahydropterin/6-carboxytetrahydropterin synthase